METKCAAMHQVPACPMKPNDCRARRFIACRNWRQSSPTARKPLVGLTCCEVPNRVQDPSFVEGSEMLLQPFRRCDQHNTVVATMKRQGRQGDDLDRCLPAGQLRTAGIGLRLPQPNPIGMQCHIRPMANPDFRRMQPLHRKWHRRTSPMGSSCPIGIWRIPCGSFSRTRRHAPSPWTIDTRMLSPAQVLALPACRVASQAIARHSN